MTALKRITFPFGTSPIVIKARPDGKEIWMANGASDQGCVVISTVTDTVTHVLKTNGMAAYLSFSPDGRTAYLPEAGASAKSAHLGLVFLLAGVGTALRGPGDIKLIDTATKQQIGAVVPTGGMPGDVGTVQPGVVLGG
jgi:DNA-binding beta-propeller fold protein YncE